jgi:type I phosphodiesterase/nucleotide pyrophosphatase
MRRLRLSWAFLLLAWARVAQGEPAERPRLVVLLVVDQLHADYVTWYGAGWKRGLRRLYDGGAWFDQAAYPFLNTLTCVGHATLGTGTYPHRHGMVLNAWYDRRAQTTVECTHDADAPLVPYGGAGPAAGAREGESARNLLVPALPDAMAEQLAPRPRTVAFSWKARSTLGLAGHHPDVALWFQDGRWVTSRAFASAPLPWLEKTIAANPVEAMLAKPWTELMPPASYRFEDGAPWERPPPGWSAVFPHCFEGSARLKLWGSSPGPDEYLGRLARAAIEEMHLGAGPSTDYLAVSFSMLDIVGHSFGPKSHEVQDVLYRLDGVIGDLFDTLDRRVGAGRYVVALSADHGIAAIPEELQREGQDAGRIAASDLKKKAEEAIARELGGGPAVASVEFHEIYLLPGVYDRLAQKPGALERTLAALRTLPGIADALAGPPLEHVTATSSAAARAAALSYFPGRSGDLLVVAKPNWIFGALGTNHGSMNRYDQHVPVILYGARIKAGKYHRAVSPADIAPTLAQLAGVRLPGAEGSVLGEALEPAPVVAAPGPPRPASSQRVMRQPRKKP